MNSDIEHIIAEAVRIEHDEQTGKLFLVFEITDPKYKKFIINQWVNDIEYKLVNKSLIENKG